jgi:hypothetical protein
MTKIAGSGVAPGSGSISQRHGSPDPDPHQNVMDPEHSLPLTVPYAQGQHWIRPEMQPDVAVQSLRMLDQKLLFIYPCASIK